MTNTVRFNNLEIGETFEFAHDNTLSFHGNLAHGPWKKCTARTYVYADNRSVQRFRVASWNTLVRRGNDCGREVR